MRSPTVTSPGRKTFTAFLAELGSGNVNDDGTRGGSAYRFAKILNLHSLMMALPLPFLEHLLIALMAPTGTIGTKEDLDAVERDDRLVRRLVQAIRGRPMNEPWHDDSLRAAESQRGKSYDSPRCVPLLASAKSRSGSHGSVAYVES
jgi:hypothetical protein